MIMIFGTILLGKFASRDTGAAVRNVSLLYLDELAGRREHLLENISLQSGDNNTTFCNLYNGLGESLTNSVLAGNARVSNLLTALKDAQFDPGLSFLQMRTWTEIPLKLWCRM